MIPPKLLTKNAARGPAPRIERDFIVPRDNVSYREDGRTLSKGEAFVVHVVPEHDNCLVKAYDAVPMNQRARVTIDAISVGEWSVPSGSPDRYGEAVFPLPSAFVGQRSRLQIELEPLSDESGTNAFVYWIFAKPGRS